MKQWTALARRTWAQAALGAAVAAAIAGTLLMFGGPASAHAELEGSDPAPGAVLGAIPEQVVLHFDDAVTLLPASVRVTGPDGRRVDSGRSHHAGGDTTAAVAVDQATRTGTYVVTWRIVSDDGHPESGRYTFSVGERTPAPTVASDDGDRALSLGLGAARWLGYLGSALLVGGMMFVLLCRPARHPRGPMLVGAAAVGVGAAAALLLKGPDDAGVGAGHALDGTLLREVLGTTYGVATLARLALALLGAALVARTRLRPGPTILYGVALAVGFALAGHAVSTRPRWISVPVDAVHVLAMSAWLGGLLLLVAQVLRRRDEETLRVARRFSTLALVAVVALVATGCYQAWRHVGSLDALGETAYGRELLVKTALVVGVTTVAACSRALVWRRPDVAGLRRTVAAEVVGVVVILAVTSALVATRPANTADRPDRTPSTHAAQ